MKQLIVIALLTAWIGLPAAAKGKYPIAPYAPPLVGATCFDPYLALGTSNIPADSSARTTVINMNALVTQNSAGESVPIGIVVKNFARQLWLIPYQGFNAYLSHTAIRVQDNGMRRERPRLITQPELNRMTSALAKSKVQVWRCFQRDLSFKPKHR